MTEPSPRRVRLGEPLDSGRHDRRGFQCGVEAVDNFLHLTAAKLAKKGK